MDKFHGKLPREDLKKLARDVNKKLVASDYKHNRVQDPTVPLSSKQAKKVRKYVYDFFDRALQKYLEYQKRKAQYTSKEGMQSSQTEQNTARPTGTLGKDVDEVMSDVEAPNSSPQSTSSAGRKRKRDDDQDGDHDMRSPADEDAATSSDPPSVKRIKEDDGTGNDVIPSPPPPPPPPAEIPMTEEERSMREQEEALMRENEEAQRLEDEAKRKQLELQNGLAAAKNAGIELGSASFTVSGEPMDVDNDGPPPQEQAQQQKQAVMSHWNNLFVLELGQAGYGTKKQNLGMVSPKLLCVVDFRVKTKITYLERWLGTRTKSGQLGMRKDRIINRRFYVILLYYALFLIFLPSHIRHPF